MEIKVFKETITRSEKMCLRLEQVGNEIDVVLVDETGKKPSGPILITFKVINGKIQAESHYTNKIYTNTDGGGKFICP